jgi:hypothetical protein
VLRASAETYVLRARCLEGEVESIGNLLCLGPTVPRALQEVVGLIGHGDGRAAGGRGCCPDWERQSANIKKGDQSSIGRLT